MKYNKYLPGPSNDKVKLSPSRATLPIDKPVIDNVTSYLMFLINDAGVLKNKYSLMLNDFK